MTAVAGVTVRAALRTDLDALCSLETASFDHDRLSRRRFKHWIGASNSVLLVAERQARLLGYGLILLHRGTLLARLYSIAVAGNARGMGIGRLLVGQLEAAASTRGRLYMRLEVGERNLEAIRLYQGLGYQTFGRHKDYYEDHQPALRMQKRIRYIPDNLKHLDVPWYRQTTEFTCGPAALMMAMAALSPKLPLSRELELDIWREATTIYMTSGHGGCHPIGLALAAQRRGLTAAVHLNRSTPLFVDGVRSQAKKDLVTLVHHQFVRAASRADLPIHHDDVSQDQIVAWLHQERLVLALISTYQMDRRKAPHWVTITAVDDQCLYVHDPDPTQDEQSAMDCQYLPISRENFDRMARFGRDRLAAFVVIGR